MRKELGAFVAPSGSSPCRRGIEGDCAMNTLKQNSMKVAAALGLLVGSFGVAHADVVLTFAPGQYDNTQNTVTTGPTTNNLQTTGDFRDAFWWSINNGAPRVGSPDYINAGQNLVSCGNSPTHACDNGTGLYNALNFTGPSISGGQSYLTICDATPADGTATKNTCNTPQPRALTRSANTLIQPRRHKR